jgi:hypothetical protein
MAIQGLATLSGIAIDGAGNAWVTNVPQYNIGLSVVELSNGGTFLSLVDAPDRGCARAREKA